MKRILIPTDFSENAQKAIDYALGLIEGKECTVYILHAYHGVPTATGNKTTTKKQLEQLVADLQSKNNTHHSFKSVLETDSVINLVNKTVIDKEIDFVFMGTQGSSAVRQMLIGGNTTDVLKHLATCPVITVPDGFPAHLPLEVAFATDFKYAFNKEQLQPLVMLSELCNANLNIVHIKAEKDLSDEQQQNKENLVVHLQHLAPRLKEVPMEDTIAESLRNYVRENPMIGLVALLKTEYGYFQKLFREPVVRKMIFQAEVPLMVLPMLR